MKIYVVNSAVAYEGEDTEGVSLTREAAQEFASQFGRENRWADYMHVQAWETDINQCVETFEIETPRQ